VTAPQHPGPASSGQFPPGPSHGTPPAGPAPRGPGQPAQWPDAPPDDAGSHAAVTESSPTRRHAADDDTGEHPAVRMHAGDPPAVLAAARAPVGQADGGSLSGVAGQRYSPTGEFPIVAGVDHPAPAAGATSGFGGTQARGPHGGPGQTGPAQPGFGGGGQAGAHGSGGGVSYTNGAAQVTAAVRAPVAAPPTAEELAAAGELVRRLTYQIESVILGKPQVVRLALTALLAEGHILLEDVPGVGKTTLARSIAASVQGQWRRIQFTPDLLPSDVTGVTIFNQGTRGFEFHPGPVFANIVIADEINRASPKTQSALLEVMEERYVTVDGVRHGVPRPFLVVATQNPIEMDGTYRLPEAQLDRFLVKLTVGYPSEAVEIEVLRGAAAGRSPDSIDPVTDTGTIAQVVQLAHRVHIADPLYAYAVRLGAATRVHPQVRVGVSPRGVIALTRAACAFALTDGRPYVVPEDLKALVEPVFAHRLLLSPDAQVRAVTSGDILREVLEAVAVPAPA